MYVVPCTQLHSHNPPNPSFCDDTAFLRPFPSTKTASFTEHGERRAADRCRRGCAADAASRADIIALACRPAALPARPNTCTSPPPAVSGRVCQPPHFPRKVHRRRRGAHRTRSHRPHLPGEGGRRTSARACAGMRFMLIRRTKGPAPVSTAVAETARPGGATAQLTRAPERHRRRALTGVLTKCA